MTTKVVFNILSGAAWRRKSWKWTSMLPDALVIIPASDEVMSLIQIITDQIIEEMKGHLAVVHCIQERKDAHLCLTSIFYICSVRATIILLFGMNHESVNFTTLLI